MWHTGIEDLEVGHLFCKWSLPRHIPCVRYYSHRWSRRSIIIFWILWNELQFLRQEVNFVTKYPLWEWKNKLSLCKYWVELFFRFVVNMSAQDGYLAFRITNTRKHNRLFSFKQGYRIFWSSFYILHGDSSGPSETWSILCTYYVHIYEHPLKVSHIYIDTVSLHLINEYGKKKFGYT